MTADPDALVAFVRARLDEKAAAARNATPGPWRWADPGYAYGKGVKLALMSGDQPVVLAAAADSWPGVMDADHIARHDPAQVLREVDAQRRILGLYVEHIEYDTEDWPHEGATGRIHGLGEAVRLLALPHSSHPDYREEWAPHG